MTAKCLRNTAALCDLMLLGQLKGDSLADSRRTRIDDLDIVTEHKTDRGRTTSYLYLLQASIYLLHFNQVLFLYNALAISTQLSIYYQVF